MAKRRDSLYSWVFRHDLIHYKYLGFLERSGVCISGNMTIDRD